MLRLSPIRKHRRLSKPKRKAKQLLQIWQWQEQLKTPEATLTKRTTKMMMTPTSMMQPMKTPTIELDQLSPIKLDPQTFIQTLKIRNPYSKKTLKTLHI